jgi:Holliday junction DNA helicase RuvB
MDSTAAADALRPNNFDGYIGQTRMKNELNIRIKSAIKMNRPLPHILLTGPAGSGKTTLASIIAEAVDEDITVMEMPFSDEDYRTLRDHAGILFLDEVQNCTGAQMQELLCLLDHNYMRPKGKSRLEWEWLTVIAATTDPGALPKPLRDRFIVQPYFHDYSDQEMNDIAEGMAGRLGVEMRDEDYMALGKAAAGTPRRIGHFLTAAFDIYMATDEVPTSAEVLDFMECTTDGLSLYHIEYLKALGDQAPMGLEGLRQVIDVDMTEIKNLEALLKKLKFIEKTPKGRDLTTAGRLRLKEILGSPARKKGRSAA